MQPTRHKTNNYSHTESYIHKIIKSNIKLDSKRAGPI